MGNPVAVNVIIEAQVFMKPRTGTALSAYNLYVSAAIIRFCSWSNSSHARISRYLSDPLQFGRYICDIEFAIQCMILRCSFALYPHYLLLGNRDLNTFSCDKLKPHCKI
jgi:hypothetical protein